MPFRLRSSAPLGRNLRVSASGWDALFLALFTGRRRRRRARRTRSVTFPTFRPARPAPTLAEIQAEGRPSGVFAACGCEAWEMYGDARGFVVHRSNCRAAR